jgi:hypothetical protein
MIDKSYEDKLAGDISLELGERKSTEWNDEISKIRAEIEKYRNASMDYVTTGVQILELARRAYDLYLAQNNFERRELLNILLLNCTFYRGTLCPTYRKPFDILAKGTQTQLMRPQYHSPQTFVTFTFPIRLHYSTTGGTRWKIDKCARCPEPEYIHKSTQSGY